MLPPPLIAGLTRERHLDVLELLARRDARELLQELRDRAGDRELVGVGVRTPRLAGLDVAHAVLEIQRRVQLLGAVVEQRGLLGGRGGLGGGLGGLLGLAAR
jgi:hypothetical protein